MTLKTKSTNNQSHELNFIGGGTFLEGSIETQGSLRIDGKVKGMVKSGDTLTVGTDGEITGEVHVKNAIVGGRIEGDVVVEEKLILEATSYLNGNVKTNKLIIDEGAFFSGKSQMGKNADNKEKVSSTPVEEKKSFAGGEVTSEALSDK
jgi:cytoskeletal protein CcmA (bactofilin family)